MNNKQGPVLIIESCGCKVDHGIPHRCDTHKLPGMCYVEKAILGKNDAGYEFPLYNGQLLSWTLSSTLQDEQEGFPRLRTVIRAMAQYRPEQLQRERYEMLRGSFDRIFGHNAKKVLAIIDEVMGVLP